MRPGRSGVFYKEADRRPHLSRYWLNHDRAQAPEQFDAEVTTVCELYAQAPALQAAGVHVLSTDAKTALQALERPHPPRPTRPGLVELQECADTRHGTPCWMANCAVATGCLLAPTGGPTRTDDDCVAHIAQTVATDPEGTWVFIVDQLNTHQAEGFVRLVARLGTREEELGVQEQSGILQAMATRAAFLQDPTHRIRFVYTPKHTSGLNQVEIWFGILVRRLLKRASFTSVDDLRARILAFIAYCNATMAKPFTWTYKGRPLTA